MYSHLIVFLSHLSLFYYLVSISVSLFYYLFSLSLSVILELNFAFYLKSNITILISLHYFFLSLSFVFFLFVQVARERKGRSLLLLGHAHRSAHGALDTPTNT